jgi:hypothetical protein
MKHYKLIACQLCGIIFAPVNSRSKWCSSACVFWKNVEKHGDDGCWTWRLRLHNGYGVFTTDSKTYRAHRYAWQLVNGSIPTGMKACHHCDNRKCVNPIHLFLGTQQDNIDDMVAKGRHRVVKNYMKGETHYAAKLNAADVRMILTDRRSQSAIAADYGISKCTVADIKVGRTWKSLSPSPSAIDSH